MSKNFSGQNLRGRSFKGQDLEDADFSNADIRGTNFKGANLRGANFTNAKAGLQRYLALLISSSSSLIIVILSVFYPVYGLILGQYLIPATVTPDSYDPNYTQTVSWDIREIKNMF